ncbi:MAG: hypothetical protein V1723_04500 [Candidatus Uhrbacteria bacterium]
MRSVNKPLLMCMRIAAAAIVSIAVFAVAAPAFAGPPPPPALNARDATLGGLNTTADQAGLKGSQTDIPKIIGLIINAALSLVGIVFLILMVYGGILWMQARGSTEDVTKAKDIIKNAIIGIIVIAIAFALTNLVLDAIISAQKG